MTVRGIYHVFAILFFLLVLNSCSKTRLLYNNADSFLLNQFDTYFDLNNTQRLKLKVSITKFLNWHRKSELNLMAERLKELKFRYQRGMKEEDFNWVFKQYDIFWKRMFSSYIIKESNVMDRKVNEYMIGLDAILKSEEIKAELFNIEHDLWEY